MPDSLLPVLNPVLDASPYLRTWWSTKVIKTFEYPMVLSANMQDRSSEVTGEPGQKLKVPNVVDLVDNPVGDLGEVNLNRPSAFTTDLVIDQYRESSIGFRNDYALNSALKEAVWAPMMGRALRTRREQYNLALETQVTAAASLLLIAGSITDTELLLMLQNAMNLNWPDGADMRNVLLSPNQMAGVISLQRHSDLKYLGNGFAPAVEGKSRDLYGFKPYYSPLVRRRTGRDAANPSVTYTINFAWVNGSEDRNAFMTGTQRGITTDTGKYQLQHYIINSTVYGSLVQAQDLIYIMATQNV